MKLKILFVLFLIVSIYCGLDSFAYFNVPMQLLTGEEIAIWASCSVLCIASGYFAVDILLRLIKEAMRKED